MNEDGIVDLDPLRRSAVRAAVRVGEAIGVPSVDPVVLQDSNNVVVWLSPHDVVAKVGTWPHSAEVLCREVEVCSRLAAAGAPVATPIGALRRDGATTWPVSLWERLHPIVGGRASEGELAGMLRRVHAALTSSAVELPSYMTAIDRARATLSDDDRMRALSRGDLLLLRSAMDDLSARARGHPAGRQPLHGEPHLGNVIVTTTEPKLLDFEAVSIGPPEWDLASMSPGVAEAFGDFDRDLLALLRLLNSARVATWCWARVEHPQMRAHAEHHLAVVRTIAR